MKKQALFIINKKSGTTDKNNLSPQIKEWIDPELYSYKEIITEYRGHASILSAQAVREGCDLVVAAGGDGTINEVAKELIQTDTLLGIIPLGSGNGFARSLKIPLSPPKAIEILNKYQHQKIDVGFINERPFLSNAGIGFDALVAKKFDQNKRRGLTGYMQTIIRSLAHHQPLTYEFTIDGEKHIQKAFLINIANGNQMGYNFKIAPQASVCDGYLDITLIRDTPNWKLPLLALRAFANHLSNSKSVKYFRCKELNLQSREEIPLIQADGDVVPLNQKKVEVIVRPKALKVVIPGKGK